ncbi:hypothetical protein LTR09_004290 [Extremus antarcticus]|uniref:Peroxin/Ferlin domain-containing protein n=1 Tax=Extremus antarcticus TaxID=702011 RepID=A0AAJ0DQB4_9PEZI|nr:hypothetical protein LTR09_004290 [Extremus antarcticus]
MSSRASSVRQVPTTNHNITLVDQERRREPAEEDPELTDGSEAPTAPPTPGPAPLTKRLTNNPLQLQQSLKREWTRRKYAKYDKGRYKINETDNTNTTTEDDPPTPPEDAPTDQPQIGEAATPQQTSYLERGRAKAAKAKTLLKPKRTLGAGIHKEDQMIDVLYENQRGFFFFGLPRYSASTLLPSDPKPWLNAQFRTSPVDIRNAQVPDPSWEWAWKSWYVDMSRDVDEEGWEYSFQFNTGFAWHGNHPWFHSFVRRRRWLRLRRRKVTVHHTKEKSHELTAEYFTVHPKTLRAGPQDDISKMGESELAKMLREKEEEALDVEKMQIEDIGTLTLALKHAAVDREKLAAVRKFVDEGGDELFYLSDRMPQIMSLFLFQSSRRQLLTDLLQRYDETSKRKQSLVSHSHDDSKTQKDHDAETRRADNLMRAVKAADEQVKKLEYWSDIKGMAQRGDTLHKSEGGHWNGEKWQGLPSPTSKTEHPIETFASKQAASEGFQDLHAHPQHGDGEENGKQVKGKGSIYYDAKMQTKDSSEDTHGTYSTAAESVSQLSRQRSKGKGRARFDGPSSLDGVLEGSASDMVDDQAQTEEGHELDPDTGLAFMTPPENAMVAAAQPEAQPPTPAASNINRKHSVQIIDPEPMPETEDLPSPTLKLDEGS